MRTRAWRRVAVGLTLLAITLPLSGCLLTPEFIRCLIAHGDGETCEKEALAPGAPAAPTGLKAMWPGSYVDLEWDTNHEPDIAHYVIYVSATPGGSYAYLDRSGDYAGDTLHTPV